MVHCAHSKEQFKKEFHLIGKKKKIIIIIIKFIYTNYLCKLGTAIFSIEKKGHVTS